MSLKDKVLSKSQSGNRKRPRPLPRGLEVPYLKERSNIPGKGDNTPVLKKLVGIVVRDCIVFNLPGVVGVVEDKIIYTRFTRSSGEAPPP